jgi:hypothetical protein
VPTTEPVDLAGLRMPIGRARGGGGGLVLFSIPFLALGPGIGWLASRSLQDLQLPLPVVYGATSLFSLLGVFLFIGGIKASVRHHRLKQAGRRHPGQPWYTDHLWNEHGENLDDGGGWITYERFPFLLGERLDVRLGRRGGFDGFEKVVITLRFVRERHGSGDDTATYHCQHWAEQVELDRRVLAGASELPISIDLPVGDYGTSLSEMPGRYWEVEMHGIGPGTDVRSRFLVPVYSRG